MCKIMSVIAKSKRGVKPPAIKLVEDMPENASVDDLMYRVYVRQKVEAGLADLNAGRKHAHDDIKREFGLTA